MSKSTSTYRKCGPGLQCVALAAAFCAVGPAGESRGGIDHYWKAGHGDIGVGLDNRRVSPAHSFPPPRCHRRSRSRRIGGRNVARRGIRYGPEIGVLVRNPSVSRPVGQQWDFLGTAVGKPAVDSAAKL